MILKFSSQSDSDFDGEGGGGGKVDGRKGSNWETMGTV